MGFWTKVIPVAIDYAARIPFEKILIKPLDRTKDMIETRRILEESRSQPSPEPPKEQEPAESPEEEDAGIVRESPRKRHEWAPPSATVERKSPPQGLTTEQTVAYGNKNIGKSLLQMEKHYAQGLKINGVACDCMPRSSLIYSPYSIFEIEKNHAQGYVISHTGEVQKILHHMKRKYDGNLQKITCVYSNVPLILTPEHFVYGILNGWRNNWRAHGGLDEKSLHWLKPEDLTENSFIGFPRIKRTEDMGVISGDLCELLGWYVAEGSIGGNRVVFSLSKDEEDSFNSVSSLIKSCFGKDAIPRDRETTNQVEFSSKAFIKIFADFGIGALKKTIPQWFLYLPEEKQRRFLKGYFSGDGCLQVNPRLTRIANTVSLKLAAAIRLLLFRLGILHSLRMETQRDGSINGRVIKGNGKRYTIALAGEEAVAATGDIPPNMPQSEIASPYRGWVSDNYVFIPVKRNEVIPFKGMVYNLGVEQDESYLTLNGAVHNCGSSRHLLFIEAECEDTMSMVDDPDIYQRIIDWVEEVGPKSSEEASKSRAYEKEYPLFSHQARDFRKELLGTLDVSALFTGAMKGKFAGVTIEKPVPEALEAPAERLSLPSPTAEEKTGDETA